MRSITERRHINGKKQTKSEREAAEMSVAFLKAKYSSSRAFFVTLCRLKLTSPKLMINMIFGYTYMADKLTQKHTYGKYNAKQPERGSYLLDDNSVCTVPTWFSESFKVDKHR